jgi:hypothetical protein
MKKSIYWVLAFVITIGAAYYQRKTGPTYPKSYQVTVNGKEYELDLIRSISLERASEVKFAINDSTVSGKLYFRRYPTSDEYQSSGFRFTKTERFEGYVVTIPQQPAAGKLQYYFEITDLKGTITYLKDNPIVVRFKGGVPALVMIPHILLMFIAMLFSTLAGLLALGKNSLFVKYTNWTLILFTLGGLVLGPVVQWYAFGDLWTGIPFGWDLTDNKTLIAFLFWVLAYVMNRKKQNPAYTILASVVLLLIYSIPHSMFGSELNYESGEVIQGIIMNNFLIYFF